MPEKQFEEWKQGQPEKKAEEVRPDFDDLFPGPKPKTLPEEPNILKTTPLEIISDSNDNPEDQNMFKTAPSEAGHEQTVEIDGQKGPDATPPTPSYVADPKMQPQYSNLDMGPEVYRAPEITKPTIEQSSQISPAPEPANLRDWFSKPQDETPEQIVSPEQKKERLLKRALRQIERAKKAIEKALSFDDIDPETKQRYIQELGEVDQHDGPTAAF